MTAPVTRTATDLDIATCQRCEGEGKLHGRYPRTCLACEGTGQRHTVAACAECDLPMRVIWSVDHTLAPLRCDACAAVCNETNGPPMRPRGARSND